MADDFSEADLQEFETLGSVTATKKGNALVKAVKKLLNDTKDLQASPLQLYLNTDSVPIVVQVSGTVIQDGQPDDDSDPDL